MGRLVPGPTRVELLSAWGNGEVVLARRGRHRVPGAGEEVALETRDPPLKAWSFRRRGGDFVSEIGLLSSGMTK